VYGRQRGVSIALLTTPRCFTSSDPTPLSQESSGLSCHEVRERYKARSLLFQEHNEALHGVELTGVPYGTDAEFEHVEVTVDYATSRGRGFISPPPHFT
jgi:hypothetical protein